MVSRIPTKWKYFKINHVHSDKKNTAIQNGPFEDVFPIKHWGYSIAMLVYQRVFTNVFFFKSEPLSGTMVMHRSYPTIETRVAMLSTNYQTMNLGCGPRHTSSSPPKSGQFLSICIQCIHIFLQNFPWILHGKSWRNHVNLNKPAPHPIPPLQEIRPY